MNTEKWKVIEGFPRYEVSDLGRFRTIEGRIRALGRHKQGYGLAVMVAPDGSQKVRHIHRLVAAAFIPNPAGLPVVHHKDANTGNNAATNLQWTTQKDNIGQAMAIRGNWLLANKRRMTPIVRVQFSGERIRYDSIREAIDELNVLTVAAGGVARPYLTMAGNLCRARDSGGFAYGFKWEKPKPRGDCFAFKAIDPPR